MTKLKNNCSKAYNLALVFLVVLFLYNYLTLSKTYDVRESNDSVITNNEKGQTQLLTDITQILDSLSKNANDTIIYSIEDLLEKCVTSYSTIQDYTCTFHKIELVEDELIEEKDILYKFMKPLCFYLKWLSGSEAIYAQGKYNNKLKFHSGNIFGFIVFSLDPKGNLAMKDNRHSILEAHIGHIINIMETNLNQAKANNELTCTFEGQEIIDKRKTLLFKSIFPESKNYYGHIIYINIDNELYLPIKITVYGWEMELLEMYHFSNIKVNIGLSDVDFDVDNPDYDF